MGDGSRGRFATPADTSFYTIVARTHMYTYAAKVWDLSIVQGFRFLSPRAKPFTLRFATLHIEQTPSWPMRSLISPGLLGLKANSRLPPREGVCLGWRACPHAQPGIPQRWGTTSCREAAPLTYIKAIG
jgi:hypothetical protein